MSISYYIKNIFYYLYQILWVKAHKLGVFIKKDGKVFDVPAQTDLQKAFMSGYSRGQADMKEFYESIKH